MLQRSPSYYFAPPSTSELAVTLRALDVPAEWTHEILRVSTSRNTTGWPGRRWKRRTSCTRSHRVHAPAAAEASTSKSTSPPLPPWQQRIAIVPDGDCSRTARGEGLGRHRHH